MNRKIKKIILIVLILVITCTAAFFLCPCKAKLGYNRYQQRKVHKER